MVNGNEWAGIGKITGGFSIPANLSFRQHAIKKITFYVDTYHVHFGIANLVFILISQRRINILL